MIGVFESKETDSKTLKEFLSGDIDKYVPKDGWLAREKKTFASRGRKIKVEKALFDEAKIDSREFDSFKIDREKKHAQFTLS